MDDETRPTLTMLLPKAGRNDPLDRIVIGMHDYYTGLDAESFSVTADFRIAGAAADEDLTSRFKQKSPSVWEWNLAAPIDRLPGGTLTVTVKDRQGNTTRITRKFRVDSE
jgi:hypothetical protein